MFVDHESGYLFLTCRALFRIMVIAAHEERAAGHCDRAYDSWALERLTVTGTTLPNLAACALRPGEMSAGLPAAHAAAFASGASQPQIRGRGADRTGR